MQPSPLVVSRWAFAADTGASASPAKRDRCASRRSAFASPSHALSRSKSSWSQPRAKPLRVRRPVDPAPTDVTPFQGIGFCPDMAHSFLPPSHRRACTRNEPSVVIFILETFPLSCPHHPPPLAVFFDPNRLRGLLQ